MKPFSFDDLVITDDPAWTSAEWLAIMRQALGLPLVEASLAARYGRPPMISGVSRPGRKVFIENHFLGSDRAENRRTFLQEVSPDDETPKRLIVNQDVLAGSAGSDVLLIWGPWDVYQDSAEDWHARDLLRPDTYEAHFGTGDAVHFRRTDISDRARDRMVIVEKAATNQVLNPVAGGAANFGNIAGGTFAQSEVKVLEGQYSYLVTTAAGGDGGTLTLNALANADHYVTFWRTGAPPNTFEVSLDNATWTEPAEIDRIVDASGETWVRYGYLADAVEAIGSTTLYYRQDGAGAGYHYIDVVQTEQRQYSTTCAFGSKGPGYAWSGAEHASTSTKAATELNIDDAVVASVSENETWSVRLVVRAMYAAGGVWPTASILFDVRGAADSARVYLEYDDAGDQFHVYINGADRFQSAAQTFAAGDVLDLILTLDFASDSYKLYVNGSLDGSDTTALSAPVLTTGSIGSDYAGANQANAGICEVQIFDSVVSAARASAMNGAQMRSRWVDALCEFSTPASLGGRVRDFSLISTFQIDGDYFWRSRDGDLRHWRVYDDTGEITVDVDSDDEVYPVIRISPRAAKTGGYAYKSFVPFFWKAEVGESTYPVLLGPVDHQALVGAAKAQADGDDWRVWSDGVESDRWIVDPNTATMETWVNLDWQATQEGALSANIGAGDTVTSVDSTTSIAGFPAAGIFRINAEVFTYTSKNDTLKRFLGVTRAAKTSTAAGHTAADEIEWIQRDLWFYYGDATATAPVVDDDYEPAFELDLSTNGSWVFEKFGEDDGLRAGAWYFEIDMGAPEQYGGNQGAAADPWIELGLFCDLVHEHARMILFNPCEITSANFTNNEQYLGAGVPSSDWNGEIQSQGTGAWVREKSIAKPSGTGAWEAWGNTNQAIDAGRTRVCLYLAAPNANQDCYVESADCTITLNATYTPTHSVLAEAGNYSLACTIENERTGESLEITYNLPVDELLEVDCDRQTVTDLQDDSSQMSAVARVEGPRRDWLRLLPGANVLTFSDTGTNELDVSLWWSRRYFE